MKILMNDYGGYPFPLELSQNLSAKWQTDKLRLKK